tara:strand:- start:499 stop:3456 length:2958 start_codon:yes stop_codon:yes gene_type:complete
MTSGQEHPVVMMGGELIAETSPDLKTTTYEPQTGFDKIYGERLFLKNSDPFSKNYEPTIGGFNKFKRPIPGIKSIDVQFKGGVRALRTANISWTCWSFEDLDRLMAHFLAHGKTVALEWGWVYNKKQFENLQTLISKDGTINKTAFADYRNKIFNSKGDFDFMVGTIKNFEFNSRDDGGFDCKTDIVSTGVNILDSNYNQQQNRKQHLNVTDSDTLEDKETKLRNALDNPSEDILKVDSALTFASYIQAIPYFLRGQIENVSTIDIINNPTTSAEKFRAAQNNPPPDSISFEQFAQEQFGGKKKEIVSSDSFIGPPGPDMGSNNTIGTDVAEQARDGANNYTYRKMISNQEALRAGIKTFEEVIFETVSEEIKSITVPNSTEQFHVKPHCWIVDAKEFNREGMKLPTDVWVRWGWFEDNVLSKFTTMVADSTESKIKSQFRSIEPRLTSTGRTSGFYESTRIRNHKFLQTTDTNKYILPGQFNVLERGVAGLGSGWYENRKMFGDETLFGIETKNIPLLRKKIDKANFEGDNERMKTLVNITKNIENFPPFKTPDKPEKEGYLRNMLVNIKVIQEAFSFSTSLNIKTALESLFNGLNADIGLWNLEVTSDEIETDRIKIIDNQITDYDFEKNPEPSAMKSIYKDGKVNTIENKPGVFYFPVWQSDSIVKRQNLTAKIPNSMQLAAMYGANVDQLKNLAGSDETLNTEGKAAGAVGFNSETKDKYTKHLDFIWKSYPSFGNAVGSENELLTLEGGEDYFNLEGVRDKWEVGSEIIGTKSHGKKPGNMILSDIAHKNIKSVISDKNVIPGADVEDFPGLNISPSTPMFLPEYLSPEQLKTLLKDNTSPKLLTTLFGGKFDNSGRMKPFFIDTVRYLTSVHSANPKDSSSVIIPLDLQLSIDGIGGIFPGNTFHSEYVPVNYKTKALFQCFDVNHTVDSSGWTVNLTGKMRATLKGLYGDIADKDDVLFDLIKKYVKDDNFTKDTFKF